ncbi:HaaA family cyclophane-containing RiPP peptide [Streptomyces sp. GbtcB7]|uniref:HaaA family cyclophane-containing RiPP peptide n=1 Tax=Streptomyces sp. GbtcB7 TaxID=2824752 RepID=UPI001C309AFD|nr:HaaA family cyclophane-containing RiPP peptide [Streptomyces sp. GbtcB7]
MPSRTSVPAPHAAAVTGRESAQGNVVLDRVAARVRQRQAVEQAATNRVGDGAHAASLIWPWPF